MNMYLSLLVIGEDDDKTIKLLILRFCQSGSQYIFCGYVLR